MLGKAKAQLISRIGFGFGLSDNAHLMQDPHLPKRTNAQLRTTVISGSIGMSDGVLKDLTTAASACGAARLRRAELHCIGQGRGA